MIWLPLMSGRRPSTPGAYCKRFMSLLAPDKQISFLVLKFDSMLERDRNILREAMHGIRCIDIFIGRMDALMGSVENLVWSWKLPAEANHINSRITTNSAFLFGPPCSNWWKKAVKVLASLGSFKSRSLYSHKFFIGYREFPLEYLDRLPNGECMGHFWMKGEQVPVPTFVDRAAYDNANPDVGTVDTRFSTDLACAIFHFSSSDHIKCVHFDVLRSISDLISKGLSSALLEAIGGVIRERFMEFQNQILSQGSSVMLQSIKWEQEKGFFLHCKSFFSQLDSEKPGGIMQLVYEKWITVVIHSMKNGSLLLFTHPKSMCLEEFLVWFKMRDQVQGYTQSPFNMLSRC